MAEILEFQLQISPSNEHPGLISFRMDWLDPLAVQDTLKSLLQHHSSKAAILQCSAFFIVQLSHPYMTTGKIIALTRWTFVGKVMSLLFNLLSRLVITFLPRRKCLLISWLQSPSAVILDNQWPTNLVPVSDTSCDWELTFHDNSSNIQRKSFQKNFTLLTLVNRSKLSGSQGLLTSKGVQYFLHLYCGSGVFFFFFFFLVEGTFFLVGGAKVGKNKQIDDMKK